MNRQVRQYERRFILLILGLFAAMLCLSFLAVSFFMQRVYFHETEMFLRQCFSPSTISSFDEEEAAPLIAPVPEETIVVFKNPETGSYDLLPVSGAVEPETLERLIRATVDADSDFGLLQEEQMFYCRSRSPGNLKLAFTSTRYYHLSMVHLVRTLLCILLITLAASYPVCRLISHIAAKPMTEMLQREKQLTADASHNLKTPLTSIMANASIMGRSPEKTVGEQSFLLDNIRVAGEHMSYLINSMLELSSAESGAEVLERTELDLSFLTEKSCLQMDSLAYDRSVTLASEIEPGLTFIGAERYFLRMLSTLIDNALKYEPAGGRVDVRLRSERKTGVLTVTNRTARLREKDIPHLFERFYRSSAAADNAGSGFGLGLPIARSMAEALGGTLKADNAPEAGARFTVRLPLSGSAQ